MHPKESSRIKKNAEISQEKEKKEKNLTKDKVNEGMEIKELYNIFVIYQRNESCPFIFLF